MNKMVHRFSKGFWYGLYFLIIWICSSINFILWETNNGVFAILELIVVCCINFKFWNLLDEY